MNVFKSRNTVPHWMPIAAVLLVVATAAAHADAIRIHGEWHENVVVVTGERMHYVLLPEDGSILNVRPEDVDEDGLRLLDEGPERRTLREAWDAARTKATPDDPGPPIIPAPATPPPEKDPQPAHDAPRTLALHGNTAPAPNPAPERAHTRAAPPGPPPKIDIAPEGRTTGMVRHVRLENVPLGEALKVILRPLGLDYVNMGSYLYISTPERLRREPLEPLETRTYTLQNGQDATLPKIILQNPGL